MRAAVLLATLAATSAANAAPVAGVSVPAPGVPARALNLTIERPDLAAQPFSVHGHFALPAHHADLPLLGPERAPPPSAPGGFSIGPLHADTITKFSRRGGKAHLAPHYRLDGVTLFGGALGGSIDGRGGMVTLQWKTGP